MADCEGPHHLLFGPPGEGGKLVGRCVREGCTYSRTIEGHLDVPARVSLSGIRFGKQAPQPPVATDRPLTKRLTWRKKPHGSTYERGR